MGIAPSLLFKITWDSMNGPPLTEEYRFHKKRMWRADYACVEARVLIEIEGGVWIRGRHLRPQGFVADAEKYNTATLEGWAVIRLPPSFIDSEWIGRIIKFTRQRIKENKHETSGD